jgi:hypothetical protein
VRVSVGSWQGVEVVRASEWVVAGVGTNLAKEPARAPGDDRRVGCALMGIHAFG